jgi:hypothetical protein
MFNLTMWWCVCWQPSLWFGNRITHLFLFSNWFVRLSSLLSLSLPFSLLFLSLPFSLSLSFLCCCGFGYIPSHRFGLATASLTSFCFPHPPSLFFEYSLNICWYICTLLWVCLDFIFSYPHTLHSPRSLPPRCACTHFGPGSCFSLNKYLHYIFYYLFVFGSLCVLPPFCCCYSLLLASWFGGGFVSIGV